MARVLLAVCAAVVCSTLAAAQEPGEAQTEGPLRLPGSQNAGSWECTGQHCRYVDAVELDFGGGVKFFADEVDLYRDSGLLVARGNVVFSNPEGRISADEVTYDLRNGRGTFRNAYGVMTLGEDVDRAPFGNQPPDVYFWGDTIERRGAREYHVTRGGFTTCVQPTPRWDVSSRDVVLKINDYAIARHMVLRVKNVPVMYLPLLYYPIQDDERATGFLMPTYGASTIRGQAISNAFFWAIGRSHDATFFHDWYTRTGQGAGAEYRYAAAPDSSGSFRFYRLNQRQTVFTDRGGSRVLPAETSYQIDIQATQRLSRSMRAQANIGYFSSVATNQLYHQDISQAANGNRRIAAGLSGTAGALAFGAYYQRSEFFTSAVDSRVYGGTPRLTASLAPRRLGATPVYASVDTTFAYLPDQTKSDGRVIGDRSLATFDLMPSVRAPLSRLTYLSVNATASYRTTRYSKSLDASNRLVPEPLARQFLAVRSDVVGPVLTKIWDTPDSSRTERMKHVIEPAFAVDYVTEIDNQAFVPVLANASDFVVGGAARITYGLTNRFLFRTRAQEGRASTTREFITVGVQQSYYSDPQASRYDSTYVSSLGRNRPVDLSPVAVTARVSPSAALDATARLEYDVATGNGLQSLTVGSTVSTAGRSATLSFSRTRYVPGADPQTSMVGSTTLALLDRRLSGSYAINWDLARGYVVSQGVALNYLAQCCGVQVDFQKVNFPAIGYPVPSDVRFNVGVVLAGLGTFSNFFGAFGQR